MFYHELTIQKLLFTFPIFASKHVTIYYFTRMHFIIISTIFFRILKVCIILCRWESIIQLYVWQQLGWEAVLKLHPTSSLFSEEVSHIPTENIQTTNKLLRLQNIKRKNCLHEDLLAWVNLVVVLERITTIFYSNTRTFVYRI